MRIWIDECLTPTLVGQANRRGYWATCNRDRGLLGALDEILHPLVIGEDCVFFTSNESDFIKLCKSADLHPGLVTMPATDSREAQWPLFDVALDYVERNAAAEGEEPAEWMVNKRVEVTDAGQVKHEYLPQA